MQFKKLAAITGSALMAGLSLVGPALASSVTSLDSISDMVSVTDEVAFPLFVVGPNSLPSDIAGGIGVAVKMASDAKTVSQVAVEGVSVGITGGASMATATNQLTMWDNLASSKQVLTATDLPIVLKNDKVVDQFGVTSPYAQYLTFNNSAANGQIVYETPNDGSSTPALGLKVTQNTLLYTYLLSFTKQITKSGYTSGSATFLEGSQIEMLGKVWTITDVTTGTDSIAMTLLSGKNAKPVTTEEPVVFEAEGKTYTVTLVAVGTKDGQTAATLSVEGGDLAGPQLIQLNSGVPMPLSDGTTIGVSSIFVTTKTGAIDSAVVFLGADKLELTDTNVTDSTAYAGVVVNGETKTDIAVSMTGTASTTAMTLDNIQITWTPVLEQFIKAGQSVTDPASGGFNIFFGGITPALDDTVNREIVQVTPSGVTAQLALTTSDGQTLSQAFAKSNSATPGDISLTDAGSYALHIVEGEAVGLNQYVVLSQNSLAGTSQNPFGHVLRVLSLQTSTSSTSQFQDVASGSTLTVTGGNTTLYLDGQAYQVCVPSTTAVYFVWGTGATCAGGVDVGSNTIDVYPSIMTSNGAWVAITDQVNITGLTTTTTYTLNLPTGTLAVVPNATVGTGAGNQAVGNATYNITTIADGDSILVRATNNAGTPTAYTTPGVMIVEGLNENQQRGVVSVRVDAGSTTNRVEVASAPTFTGLVTTVSSVSGTTLNKYVDQYGTYVQYDSTAPGTFSASIPSTQAVANVGIGESPSPSAGGAAGSVTTETVIPITADVVRMSNEITDSEKMNNDLVLLGGPCINDLVAELAEAGEFPYACDTWPGRDFGRIQVISDYFGAGQTALVIAGTTGAQTTLAARVVQTGFQGATDAQLAEAAIEVTGDALSPAYDTV